MSTNFIYGCYCYRCWCYILHGMFIFSLGGVDHNNLGDMVHQYVWLLYRLVYLFIQHNFWISCYLITPRRIFLQKNNSKTFINNNNNNNLSLNPWIKRFYAGKFKRTKNESRLPFLSHRSIHIPSSTTNFTCQKNK